MNYRIISESAGQVYKIKNKNYACLSSKIESLTSIYTDMRGLDVSLMMEDLSLYHKDTKITSPSIEDWMQSFEKEDIIFALPDASFMSNSYSNALIARNKVLKDHPDKQIYVFNTNTTGPALKMLIDKLISLMEQEYSVMEIIHKMQEYIRSVKCIAVYSAPAKKQSVSLFQIPTVNTFPKKKYCINTKHCLCSVMEIMKKHYIHGKKITISSMLDENILMDFITKLKEEFHNLHIEILPYSGISAYQFGKDSILIGYEL